VSIIKQTHNFGVPWEAQFGYAQAVRAGEWIYVSGQLSHDEAGNIVAPAALNAAGQIVDYSNMGAQIQQAYANMARILAHFDLDTDHIVEEVLYVIDIDAAFAAAPGPRKRFYGTEHPKVACTLLATPRLAFATQLVEIKFVVKA
jgi:enamine deaminase RidA (YjgF/YER057c/UK114 family)